MANYTPQQLAKLKASYASGILQVREGDTWVQFQSLSEMRQAIKDIEAELDTVNGPPRGPRLVSIKQGY